ncbi:MAG: radical SAM protein [Ignavibacteria bacterium]|nr:radical SAM protein [Ignavibacteria bacterium]
MKLIAYTEYSDIARVYIASSDNGKLIEFVESVQPPLPLEKKWVIIVSSLYGCPVKCHFCDAAGGYDGILSEKELLWQIDFLVKQKGYERNIPIEKFKIQFARVGEPTFNKNILSVLEKLPDIYFAKGLLPSISTVAPQSSREFLNRLIEIKNQIYKGNFQLQFSIHTTSEELRDKIIPIRKLSFTEISKFGYKYYRQGERKITLNFALEENYPFEKDVLVKFFPPEIFCIKITPINPTVNAIKNKLSSALKNENVYSDSIKKILDSEYNVILSIGELEENKIGSNCGQYMNIIRKSSNENIDSYTYKLIYINK